MGACLELVLQDGLHTGKGSISGPLAQSVDACMDTLATAQYGSQHIADGQVVIVMGMEIKAQRRIALTHQAHIADEVQGVQDAQGVRQHETVDAGILQGIYHLIDILGTFLHAPAPVLEIEIYAYPLPLGIGHHIAYVCDMFLRRLLQLAGAMLQASLAEQVQPTASSLHDPVHTGRSVHEAQDLDTIQTSCLARPTRDTLHGFQFTF